MALNDGFLLDYDTFQLTMETYGPWMISGVGGEGDPNIVRLVKAINHEYKTIASRGHNFLHPESEALGAVTIGGATVAFFLDPSDGYRSTMDYVWVSPALALRTQIPPMEVDIQSEMRKTERLPLLGFISVDTGKTLVRVGTENSDDYYPSAIFSADARAINEATPLATRKLLDATVGAGISGNRARM